MKAILAIALCSAVLGGCAKTTDSSTSTDSNSPAPSTDAASAAPAAQPSLMYGISGTEAPDTDDVSTSSPASPAASGAGDASATADAAGIELPVYPGAKEEAGKGLAMSSGPISVKMNIYQSSDDAATVVNWYKAHLPSNWQNMIVSNGGKTVGTFTSKASDTSGNSGPAQSVLISAEHGVTEIEMTTRKGG